MSECAYAERWNIMRKSRLLRRWPSVALPFHPFWAARSAGYSLNPPFFLRSSLPSVLLWSFSLHSMCAILPLKKVPKSFPRFSSLLVIPAKNGNITPSPTCPSQRCVGMSTRNSLRCGTCVRDGCGIPPWFVVSITLFGWRTSLDGGKVFVSPQHFLLGYLHFNSKSRRAHLQGGKRRVM